VSDDVFITTAND